MQREVRNGGLDEWVARVEGVLQIVQMVNPARSGGTTTAGLLEDCDTLGKTMHDQAAERDDNQDKKLCSMVSFMEIDLI